jgi:predicted DNA-binding transcriptional regulator YafY
MATKDTKRLSRLTAILTQFQTKRLITAKELADKFSVNIRTIYRDIRALEQAGVPILTEEGKGYTLMEGFKIPPIMFTEAEANALITAEQIISTNKDASFVKAYVDAIDKIKSVLKNSTKDRANFLTDRIHIRQNLKHENFSNYLSILQVALTNYKVIKISYQAVEDTKPTDRFIEPFAVFSTNGNWILIAFCRLRADFRYFRLDRIKHLTQLSETFAPHKMTLQEYFDDCREKYFKTLDIGLSQEDSNFVEIKKTQKMSSQKIEKFNIIGLSVRTTNENGQATQDIPKLWNKFMSEGIIAKIPNKVDNTIYCIYTDYEKDFTKPYTTFLGCRVTSLDDIPSEMVAKTIEGGTYSSIIAKGNIMQGMVFDAWTKIWNSNMDRAYTADFEVYGDKAQNPLDAEVEIFLSIN